MGVSLSTTYISPAEVARLLSNVTGGSKSVEQLQQLIMIWHINTDKCLTDNPAVVHILKARTCDFCMSCLLLSVCVYTLTKVYDFKCFLRRC